MTSDELRILIDSALEGELSEADILRLEAELSLDPVARREYYNRVLLTTFLETEASADHAIILPRSSGGHWRQTRAGLVILCASLLLGIVWFWPRTRPSMEPIPGDYTSTPTVGDQEQQSSGFAILSGQSEANWGSDTSLSAGSIVPAGELHLKSGLAQFELFSGVTLVIEGEARFSILSPMEVSVVSGKVRARVPEPAQGFRLLTEAGEVVDLGTEFAVDVSPKQAEVHVLDGEVEWYPRNLPSQRLKQGEASRTEGQVQTALVASSQSFVDTVELQRRIHDRQQSRREQWRKTSETLSRDERLIAHYQLTPESVAKRRLPNLATTKAGLAGEGAIVAATAVTNRWGESDTALDFSPAGSRVRLQVPGEYQNLTLACWVKINSLDRWYNSLFLTDGHEQGEPHWQIMDDGRLFFSVKKRDLFDRSRGEKDKHIFYSPPFWNTSLSGRWLMIATVYDSQRRMVTHYLDGEVLSEEAIPEEYLVTNIRIGDASLCNWGLPERDQPRFAIRNLNGSLDEFLLFSAALSTDEIRRLYANGQP